MKVSQVRVYIAYEVDGQERTVSTSVSRTTDDLPDLEQVVELRREVVKLANHVATKIGLLEEEEVTAVIECDETLQLRHRIMELEAAYNEAHTALQNSRETRSGILARKVTLARGSLTNTAKQLRCWAAEARSNGWTTQHVVSMRALADEIDEVIQASK